jgi:hypothetical protein
MDRQAKFRLHCLNTRRTSPDSESQVGIASDFHESAPLIPLAKMATIIRRILTFVCCQLTESSMNEGGLGVTPTMKVTP